MALIRTQFAISIFHTTKPGLPDPLQVLLQAQGLSLQALTLPGCSLLPVVNFPILSLSLHRHLRGVGKFDYSIMVSPRASNSALLEERNDSMTSQTIQRAQEIEAIPVIPVAFLHTTFGLWTLLLESLSLYDCWF